VNRLDRFARAFVAVAALSLAALVILYLAVPRQPWPRAILADLGWTWTAFLGVAGCVVAIWRFPDRDRRLTWTWIAIGCGWNVLAQLWWDYQVLIVRVRPAAPSLADIGFIASYPAFLIAAWRLLRSAPRRRFDTEIILDTVLLTFTAAALAFEFLVSPLLESGIRSGTLITQLTYALGGTALLWLILVEMLRHTREPRLPERLALLGLVLFAGTDMGYGVFSLPQGYYEGGALDFGWHLAFLLLPVAALLDASSPTPEPTRPRAALTTGARVVALVVGILGTGMLAVTGTLSGEPSVSLALLVGVASVIVSLRIVYSLRADRRYAELLEREVENQTHTLMESLIAAATAERNLRLLIEAMPEAIVVVDREGKSVEFNPAAPAMVGLPPGSERGRSVFDFVEGEARRTVTDRLASAFKGEVQRFEIPFVRADGVRGISAVLYAPVREGGRITKVLALLRDITEQRRTEAQLQQADKLAALGQTVSGVAHEINNPAAIISGFAQTLLLEKLGADQRDMVQMVLDEARRIGRITQNLLAFARAGGKERAHSDINDLLRRTHQLRAYHLSTLNITVRLELSSEEPRAWANGSEVQQVLLNLLINAEQALLAIAGERVITLRTVVSDRDVLIQVADSGPGVPPEIRKRIFDPFFTTKPEGVGTGLGLSICYGIVREHGGRIWVDSEPGHGATFSVTLPRDPRTKPRPEPARRPEPAPSDRPLAVLLVDDEDGLRHAVTGFLTRRGVTVRAVSNGASALAALRDGTFDVIISDLRMPGMSGAELLQRLRERHPDLLPRVILSTGDTFSPDTAELLRTSGVPTLVKPFDFDTLERVVRDVAAGRISGGSVAM